MNRNKHQRIFIILEYRASEIIMRPRINGSINHLVGIREMIIRALLEVSVSVTSFSEFDASQSKSYTTLR